MRFHEWISLSFAGLGLALSWAGPGASSWAVALCLGSLALATVDILLEPRRGILLISFLPAFAFALGIFTLDGHAMGTVALAAASIGLQGRLHFLREAGRARLRNEDFAKDLKSNIPPKATVYIDMDIESEVELNAIHEGHLLRVRPEEYLPVDGQLTYGSSFVDESPIGGEKEPRTKGMGTFAFAGSKNRNGTFLYRAIGAASQSHAERLSRALRKGFSYNDVFTPAFFAIEGTLVGVALLLVASGRVSSVAMLNTFLASAGAGFAASNWVRNQAMAARSAAEGISWKSARSIEKVAATETVISIATGVLTEGRLRLVDIAGTDATSEDAALRLMGPLARKLESEAAFSVLQEMNSRNIHLEPVDLFTPMPGGGAGLVTNEDVRWVDLETARLENIPMASLENFARDHMRNGESLHFLLREGKAAAGFAFSDRVLPSADAGLSLLKRQNIPYLLVSTDSELALRALQEQLPIPHVHGDAGQKETENLLATLESDGLMPLWIAVPGWRMPVREGSVVASASSAASLCSQADAVTLRSDLNTAARLVRLARIFTGDSRLAWRLQFAIQILLIGLAFLLDPRLAAALGLLPGLWFLTASRRLGEFRF